MKLNKGKLHSTLMLCCILAGNCNLSFSQIKPEAMHEIKKINLLALGDSYTIGEKVESSDRFPEQAAAVLKEKGILIGTIKIIATTGWTTDELMNAIESENLKGTYDLVTLLIGVNNQYRGRDAENYRVEFKALLRKALTFAGNNPHHVFVLSIPDWGVTPFAACRDTKKIAGEIDAYNSINKAESLKAGAVYIDITDISRLSTGDPSLLAEDGLHPSGKMYGLWAERLTKAIAGNK
jgi:lysophospholipase L1-like esterase